MCYCQPNIRTPFCSSCAPKMYGEIERLNVELDEARKENKSLGQMIEGFDLCCCGSPIANHGYFDGHGPVSMLDHHIECRVADRTASLKQQLSEARAENSSLWVRVESGEAAAYEQGKAEARQQVAMEIIEMMGGWPLTNQTLNQCRESIKLHYGLEG